MVSLREMRDEEHKRTAYFSFELFSTELSKSSGKSTEELRRTVGNPPIDRSENDLWLSIDLGVKPIGYIWIWLNPEKAEAFGYEIFLEEEVRGKGYGRLAMLEGQKLLREKNIKKIKVCVFKDNSIARKLYQSFGFKEEKFDSELNQYHLFQEI